MESTFMDYARGIVGPGLFGAVCGAGLGWLTGWFSPEGGALWGGMGLLLLGAVFTFQDLVEQPKLRRDLEEFNSRSSRVSAAEAHGQVELPSGAAPPAVGGARILRCRMPQICASCGSQSPSESLRIEDRAVLRSGSWGMEYQDRSITVPICTPCKASSVRADIKIGSSRLYGVHVDFIRAFHSLNNC